MIQLIPSKILLFTIQIVICFKLLFMFLTSIIKPGYLKLYTDSDESKSLISEEEREKQKAGIVCHDCCSRRPLRAVHCSQCYRCVIRFDHHSFLFNTCIGYNNQVYYCFFLVFSLLESYLYCFGIIRYLHVHELFPNKKTLIWPIFCLVCIVINWLERLLLGYWYVVYYFISQAFLW